VETRIFYGVIVLFLISTTTAFAQEPLLSVQTDDNHYDEGDVIVISGKVNPPIKNVEVVLQLFREGSLIQIAQKQVAQDGTYSHTVLPEGPLWKNAGEYIVRASYQDQIAEIKGS